MPTTLDKYIGNEHLIEKAKVWIESGYYHIYYYMERPVQVKPHFLKTIGKQYRM